MQIDHYNALLNGGAAIAARKIHESLLEVGIDSKFYHGDKPVIDESYASPEWMRRLPFQAGKLFQKFQRYYLKYLYEKGDSKFESFSPITLPFRTNRSRLVNRKNAIVHLHWISQFLDYTSFFQSLDSDSPVVWTLHDMMPLTGGCHYSYDCELFKTHCNNCPQLARPGHKDLSYRQFKTKRELFSRQKFAVATNSHWLTECAHFSPLFEDAVSVQTIHYGVCTDRFRKRDRQESRKRLGIPMNSLVLCFGADQTSNTRKGLKIVREALATLEVSDSIFLVTFGHSKTDSETTDRFPSLHCGFVRDEEHLSYVYSASNVFIIPSLHEAFGQTALEALSCGIPVIGSNVGGIPDMVIPHKTGRLFSPGSGDGLAEALNFAIRNKDKLDEYGLNGRSLVENEFTLTKQRDRYIHLYESLLP